MGQSRCPRPGLSEPIAPASAVWRLPSGLPPPPHPHQRVEIHGNERGGDRDDVQSWPVHSVWSQKGKVTLKGTGDLPSPGLVLVLNHNRTPFPPGNGDISATRTAVR